MGLPVQESLSEPGLPAFELLHMSDVVPTTGRETPPILAKLSISPVQVIAEALDLSRQTLAVSVVRAPQSVDDPPRKEPVQVNLVNRVLICVVVVIEAAAGNRIDLKEAAETWLIQTNTHQDGAAETVTRPAFATEPAVASGCASRARESEFVAAGADAARAGDCGAVIGGRDYVPVKVDELQCDFARVGFNRSEVAVDPGDVAGPGVVTASNPGRAVAIPV